MSKRENTIRQYNRTPSYKLATLLKECNVLLKARPEWRNELLATKELIRNILIERQKTKQTYGDIL